MATRAQPFNDQWLRVIRVVCLDSCVWLVTSGTGCWTKKSPVFDRLVYCGASAEAFRVLLPSGIHFSTKHGGVALSVGAIRCFPFLRMGSTPAAFSRQASNRILLSPLFRRRKDTETAPACSPVAIPRLGVKCLKRFGLLARFAQLHRPSLSGILSCVNGHFELVLPAAATGEVT